MPVFSVDDRRIGEVRQVNECCLCLLTANGETRVEHRGVFTIASHRVTLVCMPERLQDYHCSRHVAQN